MRRRKKQPNRKPQAAKNVVSIVGDIHQRLAEEAERRAAMTQRREAEAGALLARSMADLEGLDIDAALVECDALPPEQARISRAQMRSLRALRRCQRGDVTGGLAEWEELIAEMPDVAIPYVQRSDWLGKTDPKAGLADIERAIAIDPENPLLYTKRGAYHIMLEDLDGALADYRRALSLDPERGDVHYQMGKIFLARAENVAALAAYDRAVQIAPKYADFRAGRGECLLRLGHHERALWDFDRILASAPRDAEAHVGRGRALGMLGKRRAAIAAFSRAIDFAPDHAFAHMFRAIFRDGEEGEAARGAVRADLALAVQCDPKNGALLLKRGEYLLGWGDVAEALADTEKGIAVAPGPFAPLHFQRAQCLARLPEQRRALDPGYVEPEDERRARCTTAIEAIERAIEIGLSTEALYTELLRLHEQRGDDADTRRAVLDRALDAVPDANALAALRDALPPLRGEGLGLAAIRAAPDVG